MTTTEPDTDDRPEDASPPTRTRRIVQVAAGVLLLITIATAAVVALGDDGSPSLGDPGYGSEATSKLVQSYPEDDRVEVDDFTAQLLDGSTFDTAQLRGQVAVFNVWGSWCGPCRVEAPDLARVARERNGEVNFFGINVRDNPDAARAFERSFDVPYPSIAPDDSAQALLAFGGALASAAVPSTVVLDAEGRIAARIVGRVTYRTLDAVISDVVGSESAASARR